MGLAVVLDRLMSVGVGGHGLEPEWSMCARPLPLDVCMSRMGIDVV